jgi:hypothetical protein
MTAGLIRVGDELTPDPIFVIELRGRAGADGIHSLRAILKILSRRYGLRCIGAHEVRRNSRTSSGETENE